MGKAADSGASGQMKMATRHDWHAMLVSDVWAAIESDSNGLSEQEAARRLNEFGSNVLPEPPGTSVFMRFVNQFRNILIYLLLGSAAIAFLLGHQLDAAVIIGVVLINALIGVIQEGKAENAMNAIKQMLAPRATVIRAGKVLQIPGHSLVPGDLVMLESGNRVPADLRLIQVAGLQVQEAILTGESLAIEKQLEAVNSEVMLGDRSCMAWSGTMVTTGTGRGVVIATGSCTEIGKVSGMLAEVESVSTPLLSRMNEFARLLSLVILAVAFLLLLWGTLVQSYPFADLFIAIVGLSVAAIPEGLPAVLTISLAVGVQAMARRNAIVRKLPAIEAIGSVSVICTDKTGTLTRNEMAVSALVTAAYTFTLDGEGYSPGGNLYLDGSSVDPVNSQLLGKLGLIAASCNDAALDKTGRGWEVTGDPMEGALLSMAAKLGQPMEEVTRTWHRTDEIPFDAAHRYMATLLHDHEGHACITVKGAPEQLLALCSEQYDANLQPSALDIEYWKRQLEAIAAQGMRVLALAIRSVPVEHLVLEHDDLQEGLVFCGLAGFMDPPRYETISAVAECHRTGIVVKMITGDHRGAALAIARQIGLANTGSALEGTDIDAMDDEALRTAVAATDVFARTSPRHKLRLVEALQKSGKVVAMTGDGVNDAPALKRADVGIAMGLKGSEPAKEASQLVLADDNFATIVAAVNAGRTVYENIRKVISWTLPTSAGEALTIIVALLLGSTLPITAVQILWINLITTVTLGLALAFEPSESGAMQKPPRNPDESLLSGELIWHVVLVSLLFLGGVFSIHYYSQMLGADLQTSRTLSVNTLVIMEIFHLFFIRNLNRNNTGLNTFKGTRVVWLTVTVVLLAQIALTYLPVMQSIFETRPMSFHQWLLVLGAGVMLFVLITAEKLFRLKLVKRKAGD